jgi:hypothetical protein
LRRLVAVFGILSVVGTIAVGDAAASGEKYVITYSAKYAPPPKQSSSSMQPEDLSYKPVNELPLEDKKKAGAPGAESGTVEISKSNNSEAYKCIKTLVDKNVNTDAKANAVKKFVESYISEKASKRISKSECVFISVVAETPPPGTTESSVTVKDEKGNDVTEAVNGAVPKEKTLELAENCLKKLYGCEHPKDLEDKKFSGADIPNDASRITPYSECKALKQAELLGHKGESRESAYAIASHKDDEDTKAYISNAKDLFVSMADVYDPHHAESGVKIIQREKEDHESAFDSSDNIADESSSSDNNSSGESETSEV